MYIRHLQVRNFRAFENLEAEFHPGMNVIAGDNGSGKTALLRAAGFCLSAFAYRYGFHWDQAQPGLDDVRQSCQSSEKVRARFEGQFPCSLKGLFTSDENEWSAGFSLDDEVRPAEPMLPVHFTAAVKERALPVFGFYRADRQWPNLSEVQEAKAVLARYSRFKAYDFFWDASKDSDAFVSWFVEKTVERMQIASEEEKPVDQVRDDELEEANKALRLALDDFRQISYNVRQKRIVVRFSGHQKDFNTLSDGERLFICLFADIARRMCILNPALGDKVIEESEGIVLIDDLDIHLHPVWQRRIVHGLQKAFPKVQFIVTTHSPQILGEVAPENVYLLHNHGISHPENAYGLSSDAILKRVMQADNVSPEIKALIDKGYEALDAEDLEKAAEFLKTAQEMIKGDSYETLELGALLRSINLGLQDS